MFKNYYYFNLITLFLSITCFSQTKSSEIKLTIDEQIIYEIIKMSIEKHKLQKLNDYLNNTTINFTEFDNLYLKTTLEGNSSQSSDLEIEFFYLYIDQLLTHFKKNNDYFSISYSENKDTELTIKITLEKLKNIKKYFKNEHNLNQKNLFVPKSATIKRKPNEMSYKNNSPVSLISKINKKITKYFNLKI